MYEIGLKSTSNVLLSCEYGEISVNPNKTKFGYVNKNKALERLHFRIDDECTDYLEFMYSLQPCIGKNKCNIAVNSKWIKREEEECQELFEDDDLKTILALHCKQVVLSLAGKQPRSILISYQINFGLCAALCIFSFYYLISYPIATKLTS